MGEDGRWSVIQPILHNSNKEGQNIVFYFTAQFFGKECFQQKGSKYKKEKRKRVMPHTAE